MAHHLWISNASFPKAILSSVQEHDEPILKHLQDIKVKFSDAGQPMVSLTVSLLSDDLLVFNFTVFSLVSVCIS